MRPMCCYDLCVLTQSFGIKFFVCFGTVPLIQEWFRFILKVSEAGDGGGVISLLQASEKRKKNKAKSMAIPSMRPTTSIHVNVSFLITSSPQHDGISPIFKVSSGMHWQPERVITLTKSHNFRETQQASDIMPSYLGLVKNTFLNNQIREQVNCLRTVARKKQDRQSPPMGYPQTPAVFDVKIVQRLKPGGRRISMAYFVDWTTNVYWELQFSPVR